MQDKAIKERVSKLTTVYQTQIALMEELKAGQNSENTFLPFSLEFFSRLLYKKGKIKIHEA
jgi:hypothetical protein